MKKILFIILLACTIGCEQSDEDASSNLKKGDSFFEKKEYEVAEYYYEKIPEESPMYAKAKKKLDAIAVIKKQWTEHSVPQIDLNKIVIVEHTFTVDNISLLPVHRLSLVNNTNRTLESIDVEFSYLDKNGKILEKLVCEVKTGMYTNTQDVFKGIKPGVVREAFATSEAKILSAKFR